MSLLSESHHREKLKKHNINIKTKYIVANKILERNTNNSVNDDIVNGIRCEKKYFQNDKLVHTEKIFDSRITYSFVVQKESEEDYTCINCGMNSKLKDFIDGCPYCNTYYNIDYTDKDLGGKYYYDLVLKSNKYRKITGIIDLIVSIILSFIFIKTTSRTFNAIDISKIFIYGIILSLVLYYFFYILDAYIILGPIKKYKNKQNQKQKEFWKRTKIDKKHFFNNFNYEIRKYYYNKKDIIDYDILDYLELNEYTEKGKLYVDVIIEIRIVYLQNGNIKSKIINDKHTITKHNNEILKLNPGANHIKCNNCGSSINVNIGACEHCGTKLSYLQDWILVKK